MLAQQCENLLILTSATSGCATVKNSATTKRDFDIQKSHLYELVGTNSSTKQFAQQRPLEPFKLPNANKKNQDNPLRKQTLCGNDNLNISKVQHSLNCHRCEGKGEFCAVHMMLETIKNQLFAKHSNKRNDPTRLL